MRSAFDKRPAERAALLIVEFNLQQLSSISATTASQRKRNTAPGQCFVSNVESEVTRSGRLSAVVI
jgi:hypothetical protein